MKALEAAQAVDGSVVLPAFPSDVSGSDFNDLAMHDRDLAAGQLAQALVKAVPELQEILRVRTAANWPHLGRSR